MEPFTVLPEIIKYETKTHLTRCRPLLLCISTFLFAATQVCKNDPAAHLSAKLACCSRSTFIHRYAIGVGPWKVAGTFGLRWSMAEIPVWSRNAAQSLGIWSPPAAKIWSCTQVNRSPRSRVYIEVHKLDQPSLAATRKLALRNLLSSFSRILFVYSWLQHLSTFPCVITA